MKLSDWARQNGITYKTAWKWWKAGKLPVPARQMPTGTILVEPVEREDAGVVLYARVSSAEQQADLDRQVTRLARFAAENGMRVAAVVAEVGSALDGDRKGLLGALRSPDYGAIVVEHRDRLVRFGSEYIEACLSATGRRLVVVDAAGVTDDLPQDVMDVLTGMCAQLYGPRVARQRAERALQAASEP